MRLRLLLTAVAAVTLSLSGCSVTPTPTESPSETSEPTPTIDPSLIPSASPTALVTVDALQFQLPTGEYVFKVGEGPVWCTIVEDVGQVVCEMNEADAKYKPIPTPATCDYSYGYQIALRETKPEGSEIASFMCAGGYYSDPTDVLPLNSGEAVAVGAFNCFVSDVTVRCENSNQNYIVLGPKAWALGN